MTATEQTQTAAKTKTRTAAAATARAGAKQKQTQKSTSVVTAAVVVDDGSSSSNKGKRKRPLATTANAIAAREPRDPAPAAPRSTAPQKQKLRTRTAPPSGGGGGQQRAIDAGGGGGELDSIDDDEGDDDDDEDDDEYLSRAQADGAKSASSSSSSGAPQPDSSTTATAATTTATTAATPGGGEPEEKPKPRRGRRRLLHDEEQRKQRRKNQCKLNQRRYRARQRGMITTLSLETETLGDYIAELEAYQQFLAAYTAAAGGAARPLLVAERFVQLFRRGFALHSVEISDVQERFVRFVAAPGLVSQGATRAGVDALLLQLKRYTSYHAVFALESTARRVVRSPEPLSSGGGGTPSRGTITGTTTGTDTDTSGPSDSGEGATCVVEVSGEMELRLSRDTVMLVYPHIVAREELSMRVVGHTIRPLFRLALHFDAGGKLAKLELAVDFAGAFMALLGSAADVAELLGRALISPHCELGIDPHEEAGVVTPGENKQLSLKFILL